MRLIEILPSYEIRIFDNPPILSIVDQKYYFKVDEYTGLKIQDKFFTNFVSYFRFF